MKAANDEMHRRANMPVGKWKDDLERSGQFQGIPPNQKHVLVTFGTRVLKPCVADPTDPVMRIYGAFGCAEDAAEHAAELAQKDKYSDIISITQDEWWLLPNTEEQVECVETNRKALDALLTNDPDEQVPSTKLDADGEKDKEEEADAEACMNKPLRTLKGGCEVRHQSYAVISVCKGVDTCAVRVYGLFDSSETAARWVRNTGTLYVTEHDMWIVPACEWVHPNRMDVHTDAQHIYRNSEAQKVMDQLRKGTNDVQDFDSFMKDQSSMPRNGNEAGSSNDV